MHKQTVNDVDIRGKRLLIRVDFNVPLNGDGIISDDSRIIKSLPTIKYGIDQGARIVLISHLGRPEGKPDRKYSLKPIADHLSTLLNRKVHFIAGGVNAEIEPEINNLKNGEVALLENLRFHDEETKNEPGFAKQLAMFGDIFVNDAFGTVHRAHASTVGVTQYLPGVAGLLLAREIEYFEKVVTNPERPFMTVLGGVKVSDKVKLISNLLDHADAILIGGAMAYAFYAALGIGTGSTKFEKEGVEPARAALEKSKQNGVPIILPIDRVVAQELKTNAEYRIVSGDIPDGWMGFDIGPATVKLFADTLSKTKTVVWNGPVGVFEKPPFDKGSRGVAEIIADLNATTIIGGGDTASAIKQFGLEDKYSHVSTGGGASLQYLEGTKLPGVVSLMDKTGNC